MLIKKIMDLRNTYVLAFISIILSLTLFSGYAELRDHVQLHGDGYKDPLANLHRSPGKSKQNQKKQIQANILNTSNESKDTNNKVMLNVSF
jgi:hypothetical protein